MDTLNELISIFMDPVLFWQLFWYLFAGVCSTVVALPEGRTRQRPQ